MQPLRPSGCLSVNEWMSIHCKVDTHPFFYMPSKIPAILAGHIF